jgi:hypothetical protein
MRPCSTRFGANSYTPKLSIADSRSCATPTDPQPQDRRPSAQREIASVDQQLARLTAALADGDDLASILTRSGSRESRRATLLHELRALEQPAGSPLLDLEAAEQELRLRLADWRAMLVDANALARRMLRTLLDGRIVFTPNFEAETCAFKGTAASRR